MTTGMPPTCLWGGMNGRQYTFYIFPLLYSFNPDQPGNYIYTRRNEQGLWVPIYIGQGDLADRANLNHHHRGACIRARGATHFHCHRNDNQQYRFSEEADLLERYTNAFEPLGCNQLPRGSGTGLPGIPRR